MSQYRHAADVPTRRDLLLDAGIAEFSRHPYAEARTDRIAEDTGISKGLLFHWFGNKRAFYLACVTVALERLTAPVPGPADQPDPVVWLTAAARARFEAAAAQPLATALVSRAARETSTDVVEDVRALLTRHHAARRDDSRQRLTAWVERLPLRPGLDAEWVADAIDLHVAAWLGRRLATYEDRPEAFLADAEAIIAGLRPHLDLILNGALADGSR